MNIVVGYVDTPQGKQAADDFDASLIVVGLTDRTRTGKYLLGSDAQEVLLGAKCSVLAVKVSGA